jgi:hypothetical protein
MNGSFSLPTSQTPYPSSNQADLLDQCKVISGKRQSFPIPFTPHPIIGKGVSIAPLPLHPVLPLGGCSVVQVVTW